MLAIARMKVLLVPFTIMESRPRTPEEVLEQIMCSRRPRPTMDTPFVPPRHPLEHSLADCWSEVLGVNEVGVEDDFFSLGGDSIHMAQIASRLRERHKVEIT